MSLLQNSNAISEGGYPISNSLRFQSASSQYLSRTLSAGNRKTWTWSAWVKRGNIDAEQFLFGRSTTNLDTGYTNIEFNGSMLEFSNWSGGINLRTTQVFRDPSAWYHIVVVLDTTQATASNRVKFYVNGSQVTAFSIANYPTLNQDLVINDSAQHLIGARTSSSLYFDGYMTEANFVDGQALTPAAFGETDLLTGQWVAKKYTGTYGTNGFYLPFSNGTSTTTLGYDSSGNSNNWTLNNFTRSAGVSDCWMFDVPSGNGGVSGTQPSSNYSTLNPLKVSGATLALANLRATTSEGQYYTNSMNVPSTGKWYWEFTLTSITGGSNQGVLNGVAPSNSAFSGFPNASSFAVSATLGLSSNWVIYQNGSIIYSSSKAFAAGDVVQYALDRDNQRFWLGVNGTWYATGTPNPATNTSPTISYTTTGDLEIMCQGGGGGAGSSVVNWNFGQRSFAYTPPTGFKALCTANLPAATIKKGNTVFDATTYSGTGATQSIVNSGSFSPDLVWLKKRGGGVSAQWHMLADTIRGTGITLSSNQSDAEYTGKTSITAFNSNGFTLGADSTGASYYGWNIASDAYVAWQWDAGSSTVTNTNGSISSQVRANPTAGFSVVTYTGTGSLGTIGHGLGIAPKMIIVKSRSNADTWRIYHDAIGNTKYINLNDTSGSGTASSVWNNTSPTSSVFTVNTESSVNGSGRTQLAYCFAEIAGFSKFGSYTGNGSADGPFVYTGFRPKFVMWKKSNAAESWVMLDTTRDDINLAYRKHYANSSGAEDTGTTYGTVDFLSNGWKVRSNHTVQNANGDTYIYIAFAENPFANSNAR